MRNLLLTIVAILSLPGCGQKNQDALSEHQDSLSTPVAAETIQPADNSLETKIFLLDSALEINYRKYKNFKGEYELSGVNIIDRKTRRWLFDSEGPQIESYSAITKASDSLFVVSVFYDVLTSKDTIPQKLTVARFDLRLNLAGKSYNFSKDTLFRATPAPFSHKDVKRTLADYEKLMNAGFSSDSTNSDQPPIQDMFTVQQKLLSSFISGCDSCAVYSHRLFQKYDHALFASDADYAGEIASVFNILNKKQQ